MKIYRRTPKQATLFYKIEEKKLGRVLFSLEEILVKVGHFGIQNIKYYFSNKYNVLIQICKNELIQ